MDLIRDLLQQKFSKKKTNKVYLIACDIAKATGTAPNRWLRMVKKNEHAVQRAMNDLKESENIRNRAAYFSWLYKHYDV